MRPSIFIYGAGVAACAFAYAWADELVSPRANPGAPGIDRPIQTAAVEPPTGAPQAEAAPAEAQKTAAAASDAAVADSASATTTPIKISDPLKALQSAASAAAL